MTDELEALLAAATPTLDDLDRRLKRWERTGEAWLSVKLSALRQLFAVAIAARHRTQALRAAEERVAVLTAGLEDIRKAAWLAAALDNEQDHPGPWTMIEKRARQLLISTSTITSKDPSHAE